MLGFLGILWYNTSMKNKKNYGTSNTEMVTISRAEYENMQARIDWLTEHLLHAQKKIFGTSSEKADEALMDQLSLVFNEAEAYVDGAKKAEENETVSVAGYSRQRKQSGSARDILPENAKEEIIEHCLSPEERICPQCGEVMEEIGKETVETVKIIPAQYILQRDIYYTYACRSCEKNGISTPIVKTPHRKSVISGGAASPEAVAYLMTEKYVMHTPLYRIEQDLKRKDVKLSRQTMSNWMLRCSKDWLEPVYEELKKQLLAQDIIHADETKLQVLREPGKAAQTDSFMWLYRSGKAEKNPVVLYEYRDNRRQENPAEFLKGFSGYLQTDGYAGYNSVENVTHVGCWAHARRKFNDAVAVLPKGKKGGAALEGEAFCTKLFHMEESLAELTPEDRHTKRLELEKPILDAMLAWANTRNAAPKSKLGIALTYLKNQWPNLVNYLKDGRLELSNNIAERSIKPFVISRKNFLFANTPGGATSSAVIFSLIETAKANGLDPYKYLTHIFKTAPNTDRSTEEWARQFLPKNVPAECHALVNKT